MQSSRDNLSSPAPAPSIRQLSLTLSVRIKKPSADTISAKGAYTRYHLSLSLSNYPLTGITRESLLTCGSFSAYSRRFGLPVPKLPSARLSSDNLSANESSSLLRGYAYSSSSLPFYNIFYNIANDSKLVKIFFLSHGNRFKFFCLRSCRTRGAYGQPTPCGKKAGLRTEYFRRNKYPVLILC